MLREHLIKKLINNKSSLAENIQIYELLFQHLPYISMICDSNGIILKASEELYNLIQCTEDELANQSIMDIILIEQNKKINYFKELKRGNKVTIDCKIKFNNSEEKPINLILIPSMNKDSIIGIYSFLIDSQKDSILNDKYNELLENVINGQQLSNTGSWTHDIKRDRIFLTEEVYRILECSPDDFDGKRDQYYKFIHPEDLQKVKVALTGALNGIEYDIEYRIITSKGKNKFVHEKTVALFDKNNNPHKMIGIMQDITRSKLLEISLLEINNDLREAQKIEGVGSWKFDTVHNKVFLSEEVYHIFDIDPTNFNGSYQSLLSILHPEDQEKSNKAIKSCLQGKPYEHVFRIIKPDKTICYIISKGEPIFGESLKAVGIIGTIRDITEKKLLEDQLNQSYINLKKAQSLAHIGSWEMDLQSRKGIMSDEAYHIYGIKPGESEWTYSEFLKYVHPDDLDIINNTSNNLSAKGNFTMEFRIVRKDGAIRNVSQIIEITCDEDGKPFLISGTIQDITEKKKLEKEIILSKEFFQQEYYDFYQVIDANGTILYMSHIREDIFGCFSNIVGKNIFDINISEDEKKLLQNMLKHILITENNKVRNNLSLITRDGKKIYYEITMMNQLTDPMINGINVNWYDITEKIELQKQLSFLATHDEITKLPNRIYFREQISRQCEDAKKKGTRFALVMLDIDGFKYINDALGYLVADTLIIEISRRLINFIGQDQFICRYSGDQFGVILTSVNDKINFENYTRDLMALFTDPFHVEAFELYITISMGISIFPEDGQDVETLKKHAHIAMFHSKDLGKNQFRFYSPDMDIQSYKDFVLRNDLHKAIELNQFKVFYQPIVNLETNEIIAAEALIRWEHPIWGLVPPKEFISIAEDTGFIIDLGKWMLNEVCNSYVGWLYKKLPEIKVSINYSAIQFYEKGFVNNIIKTINKYHLKPHFFIIEILENILINDINQVLSDMQKLQQEGIYIALDDFGTGFSSLEYLNRFNIDILKIDRSFIMGIPSMERNAIITDSVINLAKKLKIKVIAEGIETWEQLLFLKKSNCFSGQGYLYSKPVPCSEFERLLARKKCRPVKVNNIFPLPFEERRKFFRIKFPLLLEAKMTIIRINGNITKVGYTNVLIKNIGPGGLCFMSNIRFPLKHDIILQFSALLMNIEFKVKGRIVWGEIVREDIFEYGIEFTFSEEERDNLTGMLNKYQVRMRNNDGQYEGSFVYESFIRYFNLEEDDTEI